MQKQKVAVVFGGRSGEHEVSLRSAASVIRHLDPNRFEVIPIGIDKQGQWRMVDLNVIQASGPSIVIPENAPPVMLRPYPSSGEKASAQGLFQFVDAAFPSLEFDVAFPVMHGPLCEDGAIQGLFELADVAYVGCGVLASSMGMDKEISKRIAREFGIPIVPYVTVNESAWKKRAAELTRQIENELNFPVFVKPANLGSSVGVHRVKRKDDLSEAMQDALKYDTKILVEKAVQCREIELAVLESLDSLQEPGVSLPGEVVPTHEFYSYEAKYLDENGAKLMIPAPLTESQIQKAKKIARDVFVALECEGMARCDLFLDKQSGEFYFNEVNTIPGFTSISMYPKMWEASGISYQDLLSRLVDLALLRHHRRRQLVRDFHEPQ